MIYQLGNGIVSDIESSYKRAVMKNDGVGELFGGS